MKLRNKKTGKIREYGSVGATTFSEGGALESFAVYGSLAELNEEWEDYYGEPKEYWYMSNRGDIRCIDDEDTDWDNDRKLIGNYFETKEEAEKAVEKLKAFKRLEDKGFEFKTWGWEKHSGKDFTIWFTIDDYVSSTKDLDLLFGGKNA